MAINKGIKLGQDRELPRYGVAKIWSCQDMELPRYGVAKIWSCQDMELPRYGVAKIWSCQIHLLKHGKLL